MIELQAVSKAFQSEDGAVPALAEVTFNVAKGEFVSVVGPSGSGKTTLIRIIGSLLEPSGGTVAVNGLRPEEARRRGMFSFVFQKPVLLPWRRVIDNVRLPLEIIHRETRDPQALLQLVGLDGFQHRYPDELSGGMQQRVAIARALTFDPQVLLMDEPFSALDEFARNALNLQLLKLWTEIHVTILFITHSIAEAVFLADRVIVLSARPARVDEVVTVPFKRPRVTDLKETAEFQELVRWLRKKLESHRS